jgi:hypothetical protein
MLDFLMPLRRLTALGLSIFLSHHPNKGDFGEGQAARGSGALSGFADILLEMTWYTRASEDDRRRRLTAFSRFTETPRQLVIELNAEGTDYLGHGTFLENEFSENWEMLRRVLETAPEKLTRPQIARRWPPDATPPADVTLWRWLERAVNQGLLLREGSGLKSDPYRYWLPGQEEQWKIPRWQKEIEELTARLSGFNEPLNQNQPPPAPPS